MPACSTTPPQRTGTQSCQCRCLGNKNPLPDTIAASPNTPLLWTILHLSCTIKLVNRLIWPSVAAASWDLTAGTITMSGLNQPCQETRAQPTMSGATGGPVARPPCFRWQEGHVFPHDVLPPTQSCCELGTDPYKPLAGPKRPPGTFFGSLPSQGSGPTQGSTLAAPRPQLRPRALVALAWYLAGLSVCPCAPGVGDLAYPRMPAKRSEA